MANRPNTKTQDQDPSNTPDENPPQGAPEGASASPSGGEPDYAAIFEAASKTFVKPCGAHTASFAMPVTIGYVVKTESEARAFSSKIIERGMSVANSNVTRPGKADSKISREIAEAGSEQAYINKYLATYKLSDDVGSEFAMTLLEKAIDRVVYDTAAALLVKKGKPVAPYETKSADLEERAGHVLQVVSDTKLLVRYRKQILAAMHAILAEKHEVKTRKSKSDGGMYSDNLFDDDEGSE